MIFLYNSTTLVYYLLIILMTAAISAGIFFNDFVILAVAAGLLIAFFFGVMLLEKLAIKKYTESLKKLDYDIQAFLDEQYKLLNRLLIGKKVRNILKVNIAVGYAENEQYNDALNVLSEFGNTGYSSLAPALRFSAFVTGADCFMKLHDNSSALFYIQSCEALLRSVKFSPNVQQRFSLTFEYLAAKYNYSINDSPENARALINRINNLIFGPQKSSSSFIRLKYELGTLYLRLGDTESADSELFELLKINSNLPSIKRVKEYNRTGDMSALEI